MRCVTLEIKTDWSLTLFLNWKTYRLKDASPQFHKEKTSNKTKVIESTEVTDIRTYLSFGISDASASDSDKTKRNKDTYIAFTLSSGPWTWPVTVPWLVFLTQPTTPSFLASSSVYWFEK